MNTPLTDIYGLRNDLLEIVTDIISFVNLIISKDQKVSEFRQEWINKLRDDLAEYLGHISAPTQRLLARISHEHCVNLAMSILIQFF